MTTMNNARRSRFALSSTLAMATALVIGAASPARAQSFNASGTVTAGSASIGTGSGTTDVSVTGSAVIDWSPTDTAGGTAPIIFQNSGTTATFSGVSNFTVLNRILPATATRAVQFDGTVLGRIGASAPVAGGTVYFYSPGGIIAGATSVFDVGNLGLTSSPVAYDAATGEFDGGNAVSFGAANAGSSVSVLAGAQLTATGYLALVAPVVVNDGTITSTAGANAGGGVALVAANAADITFSPDGLFNIAVTQGTAATGTVLSNSGSVGGTTGGTAGTASHRVYMVAIPQNQAITMAIAGGSTLGFDIAGAASVDGNAVVLSGGYDVVTGEADVAPVAAGGTVAITVDNADATSRLSARASDSVAIVASGGVSDFASDVTLLSVNNSSLTATGANGRVNVAGALEVSSIDPHTFAAAGANVTGGAARLRAQNGGTVDVTGALQMTANGFGGNASAGSTGSGTGGALLVEASLGGTIRLRGAAGFSADGYSGLASGANVSSGDATGGTIDINALDNGSLVQFDGVATIDARGFGGNAFGTGTAGAVHGGQINITATGGTGNAVTFGQDVTIYADASGGTSENGGSEATGGVIRASADISGSVQFNGANTFQATGFGGSTTVGAGGRGSGGLIEANTSGTATIGFGNLTTLYVRGNGGATTDAATGGAGVGGAVQLAAGGGTINFARGNLDANASGGAGQTGGAGTGGLANLTATTGGVINLTGNIDAGGLPSGATTLSANGAGAATNANTSGTGGTGTGGGASVVADTGGSVTSAFSLYIDANGAGGDSLGASVAGASGQGGISTAAAYNGASLNFANLGMQASARGSGGDNLSANGVGGTGAGGIAQIRIAAATYIGGGNLSADSSGDGGFGDLAGGEGLGGVSQAVFLSGANVTASSLDLDSGSSGGDGFNGGAGTGGSSTLTITNSSANLVSGIVLEASGTGGRYFDVTRIGNGGRGVGGTAQVTVTETAPGVASLTSGQGLSIRANGFGGMGRNGGTGQGGDAGLAADGGDVSVSGTLFASAYGDGGSATDAGTGAFATGGAGLGGNVTVLAQAGGALTLLDQLIVATSGTGGNSSGASGIGGLGQGGSSELAASSGAITANGPVNVEASATGGSGAGGGGANGGVAILQTTGTGTFTMNNPDAHLAVYSYAISGAALVAGGSGGNALGGNAQIVATGGAITVSAATVEVLSLGLHGGGSVNGTDGGNGRGGTVSISQDGTGAITITAPTINLNANGRGGDNLGGGDQTAGTGTGGDARIAVNSAAGISLTGQVSLQSEGFGGAGAATSGSSSGGNAFGGLANIGAVNGANSVSGQTVVLARAFAGSASLDGSGGNAVGGQALVGVVAGTTAGSITLGGSGTPSYLEASAFGGLAQGAGLGGDATGGTARVFAVGGNLTANNPLSLQTYGIGGSSVDGAAGDGTGGFSSILANGSTLSLESAAGLYAFGVGGYSSGNGNGGAGTGGESTLRVSGGGTIAVADYAQVMANGFGGSSFNGASGEAAGGSGAGGDTLVLALNGTITTARLDLQAVGIGGYASGLAGAGTGGTATVLAGNAANGPSRISTGDINAYTFGAGGGGTAGLNPGDAGGTGGSGTGGRVVIVAASGSGELTTGAVNAQTFGAGGRGGDGVSSTGGVGGNGGAGGTGTGGFINIGTESGAASSTANGTATYASIQMSAQGSGGGGGNGGTGLTQGNGGDGGAAFDGTAVLLVRGSHVTVTGTTDMFAGATGGDGGAGAVAGVGGDATVGAGGIGVLATNRFQVQAQRGTLNAGAIVGTSNATGGTGSVNGLSLVADSPLLFQIDHADAAIASVDLSSNAGALLAGAAPSTVSVIAGTATVAGRFGFATAGGVTLSLDGGDLVADNADIFGSNWVLGAAPVSAGTLRVNTSLGLDTDLDLVTYANIAVNAPTAFFVPGDLRFGNLSGPSDLIAQAGGSITLGTINAGGSIDLLAGGNITTLGQTSGAFIDMLSSSGTIRTGALFALQSIDLSSLGGGTTVSGDAKAGDTVVVLANGDIVIGNVSAGIVNPSSDPLATYRVGLGAAGNLTAGNVSALGDIGLLADGGTVQTGALQGHDMLVLASTGASVRGLTSTGRVLFADASMAALGGAFDSFDANPVFAATPVAMTGPITLGGPVSATNFLSAHTSGNFTATGALSGGSRVNLQIGGTLTATGGTLTGGAVTVQSAGAMALANVSSNRFVILSSQTGVSTGNITAADRVFIGSPGNVTTGNIVSDPNQFNTGSLANTVQIGAGGTITTGNIRSVQSIALAARNINSGVLNARFQAALLAADQITSGSVLAGAQFNPSTGQLEGASGGVLIGNPAMLENAGGIFNLDYAQLFTAAYVPTGGSVTINGSVIARSIDAYAGGDFTASGMAGFGNLDVVSGGLVTVRGRWFSPDMQIESNDIAILPAQQSPTNPNALSGLNAGTTGEITLISTNARGAFIGDGLTGDGYGLSQAEFSLINSGSLNVYAIDQTGALIDMTIGDLAMTGPQAGSTIDDPNGVIRFATGTRDAAGNGTPSGGIRIAGNVSARGLLSTNRVEILADLFELDAATGSLRLTGSGTALGGEIRIEAAHINIADGAILGRLEDDPLYAGRIADLNAPAAVNRPEGVISAGFIDLYPAQTLYIQNTGTLATPAGFLAADVDVTPPAVLPAGGVQAVVNGQFATDAGVLSGRAAYDAAAGADFAGFTAESQLNSCLFTGGCVALTVAAQDAVRGISSEIQIVTALTLGDAPEISTGQDGAAYDEGDGQESQGADEAVSEADEGADSEQGGDSEQAAEDEADAEASASSPIAPPAPLVDTRALTPPGDVTQPVTGSGNPALIGSAVNESTVQGDAQ